VSDELRPAIRDALGLDPLVSFDDYEFVDRARFLRAEVEQLQMRLAACGVAAMCNTPETVAQRITRDNPYWSASYGDACGAVDREMLLRGQLAEAREALRKYGRHMGLCASNAFPGPGKQPPCDCGLAAALGKGG